MYEIYNIDTSFESYQRLINFYEHFKNSMFNPIDISLKKWFGANMSSALGALLDKLSEDFNEVSFANIDDNIKPILLRNEFLNHYGFQKDYDTYNSTVRFLKLDKNDSKYFNSYIAEELMTHTELPKMSKQLKNEMTKAIYEIFVNAQMHSDTRNIYTCGQHFYKNNEIEFTITDLGIGFKNKINNRFKTKLSSTQAIKWATSEYHTTKENVTGGLGLTLLKEFIKLNEGKLQIISDDGFYQFDAKGETLKLFSGRFPGSIVNMQFRTDDTNSYMLKKEIDHRDLF